MRSSIITFYGLDVDLARCNLRISLLNVAQSYLKAHMPERFFFTSLTWKTSHVPLVVVFGLENMEGIKKQRLKSKYVKGVIAVIIKGDRESSSSHHQISSPQCGQGMNRRHYHYNVRPSLQDQSVLQGPSL